MRPLCVICPALQYLHAEIVADGHRLHMYKMLRKVALYVHHLENSCAIVKKYKDLDYTLRTLFHNINGTRGYMVRPQEIRDPGNHAPADRVKYLILPSDVQSRVPRQCGAVKSKNSDSMLKLETDCRRMRSGVERSKKTLAELTTSH